MVLSTKKKVGFPGRKEKAQINCDCESKEGPIVKNCDCSVIVETKKGKLTKRGIVGGAITVVQLDVPFLQVFLRRTNGKGLDPI